MQLQLRKMWRLVDTVEFEITLTDETLLLRLELFSQIGNKRKFRSRVSRYDAFLLPVSPSGAEHGDHEIQVTDLYFEFPEFDAETVSAALEVVVSAISEKAFPAT